MLRSWGLEWGGGGQGAGFGKMNKKLKEVWSHHPLLQNTVQYPVCSVCFSRLK